jgi:hypothetical protein
MRLNKLLAGFGLICSAVGCHHTAGFCDCNPTIQPCAIYGMYPAVGYNQVPVVAVPVKQASDTQPAEQTPASTVPATAPASEKLDLPKDQ